MYLTLTLLLSITRYILNTATIRETRMKPVQMIDSKLRGYTSYIVETIRFDINVCLCVNVK